MSRPNPEAVDGGQPSPIKVNKSFASRVAPYAGRGALAAVLLLAACSEPQAVSPVVADQPVDGLGDPNLGEQLSPTPTPLKMLRVPTRIPASANLFSAAEEALRFKSRVFPAGPIAVQILEGEMSPLEIAQRRIDPQDDAYIFAKCLLPNSLSTGKVAGLARVDFAALEAAPLESKTRAEVVECLKNQPSLASYINRTYGIDFSTLSDNEVAVSEAKYRDLKLPNIVKMTFKDTVKDKDGNLVEVVRWGDAIMLDDPAEVKRRRDAGEKMIFSKDEMYTKVDAKGYSLIFRRDCANLIFIPTPTAATETPTPVVAKTPTITTTPRVDNTPVPTSPPATETPRPVVNTPAPTNTPRPAPTNTPVPPTRGPEAPAQPTAAPTQATKEPILTPGATASVAPTRVPNGVMTATPAPTQATREPVITAGPTKAVEATRTTVPNAPTATPLGPRRADPTPAFVAPANTPTPIRAGR